MKKCCDCLRDTITGAPSSRSVSVVLLCRSALARCRAGAFREFALSSAKLHHDPSKVVHRMQRVSLSRGQLPARLPETISSAFAHPIIKPSPA